MFARNEHRKGCHSEGESLQRVKDVSVLSVCALTSFLSTLSILAFHFMSLSFFPVMKQTNTPTASPNDDPDVNRPDFNMNQTGHKMDQKISCMDGQCGFSCRQIHVI